MASGLPWGLALVSGVNTYLPLFIFALFARFSHMVHLSPRFEFLVSDQALIVLGILAASEVLAQKFPVLDNVWDFLHTVLRPMAGAIAAGAAVDTNQSAELIAAMLMGGSLAAAAHSTKSGLRLVSTTKSFGVANIGLSFGEDAAVITGTLLSVYWPWVMLGVVVVFVFFFLMLGPWLLRTLSFDCRIAWGWLRWAGGKLFRVPEAQNLAESLMEFESPRLKRLETLLSPGESLSGVICGWRRSKGGPRKAFWLLTSNRMLVVDQRMFRNPKAEAVAYADLAVARSRNLGLFSRIEVLTLQNQNFAMNLRRLHGCFGQLAVQEILARKEVAEKIEQMSLSQPIPSTHEKSESEEGIQQLDTSKKYSVN